MLSDIQQIREIATTLQGGAGESRHHLKRHMSRDEILCNLSEILCIAEYHRMASMSEHMD